MDFPILPVKAGAPVGLKKLNNNRFLNGWVLLNAEMGMQMVEGDTEDSDEINDVLDGDWVDVNVGCCTLVGMADGSLPKPDLWRKPFANWHIGWWILPLCMVVGQWLYQKP